MRDTQRWAQRQRLFERLEPRVVLNAAPVARDDPWYYTAEDTGLTVTTSDTTLLDNDWDPEGDSLTASVVDSPDNGSISNFSGSDGTFTYTPDTSYVGFDSFTYKVNDGTDDSNIVTVAIAVGLNFGPRTNLDEQARDAELLTGDATCSAPDARPVSDLRLQHFAAADRGAGNIPARQQRCAG